MAAKKAPKKGVAKKKGGNKFSLIVENLIIPPTKPVGAWWPKEIKHAKQLCEKYGYEKLLVYAPRFSYPSIAYMLAAVEDFAERVERNWLVANMKLPERVKIRVEDAPVVGETLSNKKINTLKQWLK